MPSIPRGVTTLRLSPTLSIFSTVSVLLATGLLLVGTAAPGSAQLIEGVPVAVEIRPGITLPTGGVSETGPGLGAEFGYGVTASTRVGVGFGVEIRGGYQYGRLGCGACAGVDLQEDLAEEGFEAGLRWTPGLFTVAGFQPWIDGGALIGRKLQISGDQGDLVSDPALGWSAGAGVQVPLGRSLALSPGIHFRGYTAEFTVPDLGFDLFGDPGTFAREVEVLDVSFEVGLSYGF